MSDLRARDFSQEERERLAKEGKAMPDGSFPIVTREDLENAIQAIGRAKDPEAAKRHIKKRARELGLEELIPENWNSMDIDKLRARMNRPTARLRNQRTDWYRIQNKADQIPEIFIYDEIGYFDLSAKGFIEELRDLDVDELTIHVNSPGGDIFDGLAIYQALRSHRASVTVVVDGLAASIASVIAMAGNKVIMAPKASMMIHEGWSVGMGNAADMRKMADVLDKQSQIIASVYAERSGQSENFWRDRMREETWYGADEAVAAGLADEVEGKPKTSSDEGFDLSVFAHAGRTAAPDPVIKPQAAIKAPLDNKDQNDTEPVQSKEPKPFSWDFQGFRSALKEGMNA